MKYTTYSIEYYDKKYKIWIRLGNIYHYKETVSSFYKERKKDDPKVKYRIIKTICEDSILKENEI